MEKRSSAGKVKLIYYLLFFYEGRGHWNVSYTGTKSFIITKSLGTFIEILSVGSKLKCQPIIVIYRRGDFVYNYWRCIN